MEKTNLTPCESCPLGCANRRYIPKKTKPVDVLFLLDSPNLFSMAQKRFITGDDTEAQNVEFLMNSTLQEYKKEMAKIYGNIPFEVTHDYAYTVSCVVDEGTDKTLVTDKKKPNTKLIKKCNSIMVQTIRRMDPKIIIPLGINATKALYIIFKKFNSVVAKTTHVKIMEKYYPAIPLLSASDIAKNDNKYTISKICITTALEHIFHKKHKNQYNIDISNYHFPRTVEEVKHICRNVIIPACSGENKNFLSYDIETNTKDPFRKDAKILMISFSWGEGYSCAIWLDSKFTPYDPKLVYPYVQEVLNCDARKAFHNGGFDYKFLAYLYKFSVKNLCWDTMLAQHILNENMKGLYNLEFLAGYYVPRFENYKKLALKKISKKDLPSDFELYDSNDALEGYEEDDTDVFSVQTSVLLNNDHYVEIIKQYEEEMIKYNELMAEYNLKKAAYKLDIAKWDKEYKKFFQMKLSELDPTLRKQVKEIRDKAKLIKPVSPSKKDIIKPIAPDIEKFSGEDTKSNFEDYDPTDLALYNAMDSDITRRIACKQFERIKEEDPSMFQIIGLQHIPAMKALSEMEYVGANTDQGYLDIIETELKAEHEQLYNKIVALINREKFNPNSGEQLAHAVHSIYGIKPDPEKLTKSGNPSMSESSLLFYVRRFIKENDYDVSKEILLDDKKLKAFLSKLTGNHFLAFMGLLFKYKDVHKTYSTTIKNFRKHTEYDGRLRTSYKQNGTTTGRLASSNLNLQNIALVGGGKNLKKFIIPDQEDHILVNIDIKAAEIRCLLAYAPEKGLVDSIRSGGDFHCTTASEVWFDRFAQYVTEKDLYMAMVEANNALEPTADQKELIRYRKMTKAVNFGLMYGITKYGLSRDLNCTEEEAQQIIDKYFARYKQIKKYVDDVSRDLRRNREVQSLTRRKRRFPRYDLNPFRAYRQAINFKIQNISSDLVVRQGIAEMHKEIERVLEGRIVLTVHDSILISMPKALVHKLKEYLDDILIYQTRQKYPWMVVDFEYDMEWGYNYGEMSKLVFDESGGVHGVLG